MAHPGPKEIDEGEIAVILERLQIRIPNLLDVKKGCRKVIPSLILTSSTSVRCLSMKVMCGD